MIIDMINQDGGGIREKHVSLHLDHYGSGGYKYRVEAGVTFLQGGYVVGSTVKSNTPVYLQEDVAYRVSLSWKYDSGAGTMSYKLYLNGVQEGTTYSATGYPLYDAAYNDGLWVSFDHSRTQPVVYDVRWWNYERTAAEILASAFTRLSGSESGLMLYWKMDEGTGTAVNDSSPNNRDGAFVDGGGGYPIWMRGFYDWTGMLRDGYASSPQTKDWRYFAGTIRSVRRSTLEPDYVSDDITCYGYETVLDRREAILPPEFWGSAVLHFENLPARFVVAKLIMECAPDEGIGTGALQVGGGVLSQTFDGGPVAKALDALEDATGRRWWVDFYKELRFEDPGAFPAAWDIDSSDSPQKFLADSASVEQSKDKYANRLIARIKVVEGTSEAAYRLVIEDPAEIAARATAEGGSGIHERHEDLPRVRTVDQGVEILTGRLFRAVSYCETVSYKTDVPGLRAGARQHITIPFLGVDDDYFIDSVDAELQGGRLRYAVSATTALVSLDDSRALSETIDEKTNFTPVVSTVYVSTGSVDAEDGIVCSDTRTVTSGSPEKRIGYIKIGEGEIG